MQGDNKSAGTPGVVGWNPIAAGLREAEQGLWVAADRPALS